MVVIMRGEISVLCERVKPWLECAMAIRRSCCGVAVHERGNVCQAALERTFGGVGTLRKFAATPTSTSKSRTS
jgi:hypothetical protein